MYAHTHTYEANVYMNATARHSHVLIKAKNSTFNLSVQWLGRGPVCVQQAQCARQMNYLLRPPVINGMLSVMAPRCS